MINFHLSYSIYFINASSFVVAGTLLQKACPNVVIGKPFKKHNKSRENSMRQICQGVKCHASRMWRHIYLI